MTQAQGREQAVSSFGGRSALVLCHQATRGRIFTAHLPSGTQMVSSPWPHKLVLMNDSFYPIWRELTEQDLPPQGGGDLDIGLTNSQVTCPGVLRLLSTSMRKKAQRNDDFKDHFIAFTFYAVVTSVTKCFGWQSSNDKMKIHLL